MKLSHGTFRAAVEFCAWHLLDCDDKLRVLERGEHIPEIPTVYVHLLDGQIEYIGQTSNLRKRMARHELDRGKGKRYWDHIAFFVPGIPDLQKRLVVETILIAAVRPSGNKALLLRLSHGNLSEIRYRRKGRRRKAS